MAGRRIRDIATRGDTAMALATGGWTVEMVHALPEDGMRSEVIDGDLYVSPSAS